MAAKRTRRSRAELKALMLEAGSEVLLDLKPELGFEHLTYSAVFDHLLQTRDAKVTIGSVHERIWGGQREFQLEVLESVIMSIPDEQFALPSAVSTEAFKQADLTTRAGRLYAVQNMVRLSRNASWQTPSEYSPDHAIALSVRLRLWNIADDHPEAAELFEVTRQYRDRTVTLYTEFISKLLTELGFRVRPDMGDPEEALSAMVMAGTAATTGYTVDVFPEANVPRDLPTGPNGEMESWYPISITAWALVRHWFEFADEGLTPAERRI